MTNLIIFGVTVVLYYAVSLVVKRPESIKNYFTRFILLAFLCMPININDNIFTVIGNATSEKNIYSIASLYQKAEKDAVAIVAAGYQKAGQDAVILWGVAGDQQAGRDAIVGIIGVVGHQQSGRVAVVGTGIAGYQFAPKVGIAIGISGYQKATEMTESDLAIACYQKVGKKEKAFGMFSTLKK